VVYPRSPFTVVPNAVLEYVSERIPNVLAAPRSGLAAACVTGDPKKTNTKDKANVTVATIEIPIFFFIDLI
jgi:hypothetical protein